MAAVQVRHGAVRARVIKRCVQGYVLGRRVTVDLGALGIEPG